MNSPSTNTGRGGDAEGSASARRLQGLDPLGEEDEEDTESEEEDNIMQSQLQKDSNKFEMLCDGVLNSQALVQSSLADFLLLKDELLLHALPASLMSRLTMVSGRVFRSTTDLHTPVTELVRLVRVYSDSWEAKSAALKKLHSDYESKHKQLNIAIRRLQLADATQKRIAREKRIMNWEKLFAKLTSCRGHGRRWKFLIDSFKQKAKLGADHLQHYIDTLDKQMEAEEEDADEFQDAMSRSSAGDFKTISSMDDELDFDSDEYDEEEEEDGDNGSMAAGGHRTRQTDMDGSDMAVTPGKKVKFKDLDNGDSSSRQPPDGSAFINSVPPIMEQPKPVYIEVPAPKPPCRDNAAWTHEPQYDYFLNVNMCRPVGVDRKDIKCSLNFRKQFKLSEVYEKPATPKGKTPPHRGGLKGKTLMGSRGPTLKKGPVKFGLEPGQPNPDDEKFKFVVLPIGDKPFFELPGPADAPSTIDPQAEPSDFAKTEEPNPNAESDNKPTESAAADNSKPPSESEKSPRPSTAGEEPIKLGVHHGQYDELVAWANVSLADLESLDLRVRETEEEMQGLVPTMFPIYPVAASRSERNNAQTPVGYVKLAFYYTRVNRPYTMDKDTESDTLNDIVLDLTGVDLTKIRKEELSINKTFEERCLSAMSVASVDESDKPEIVLKTEVDLMVEKHEDEMLALQQEYEHRLTQLAQSLEALQNEQLENIGAHDGGKRSSSTLQGWTSTDGLKSGLKAPPASRELGPIRRKAKRPQNLPEWGANLPKDFLERVHQFEEEKANNREELFKKTRGDVEEKLLKQLASKYQLRLDTGDDAALEKDVCLPAVFMPSKTGTLYNPRAHHYFHPSGSVGQLRLTQPPSMFQLPPLPHNNRMAVINLFDIRRNFEKAMGLTTNSETIEDAWDSRSNTPSQFYSQPGTPQTPHTPTHLDQGLEPISESHSVS